MYDSPEELLRKIRLGEDTSLELKTVRFRGNRVSEPKRDELANELAAIANTRNGVLVLGVDDKTREIDGIPVPNLDATKRYVYEICNESIKPPVVFQSFRMELPDSTGVLLPILEVDIPRSLFVHESPGGYFHRHGSSKRKSTEESGAIRASVAGVLLCCERPDRFLPNAYVEAVRYRGIRQDSNYQTDAQRIYGPLDAQIKEAMAFLKRNQTVLRRLARAKSFVSKVAKLSAGRPLARCRASAKSKP